MALVPGYPRSDDHRLTRWERWSGHAGYVAEGLLYLLVGFFALLAALGHQSPSGSRGALARLAASVPGDALLALLAAGLAAYVLWQLVLAIADPEHRPARRTAVRRVARLGHLLDGLFHCVFVGEALWSLLGLGRPTDERQSQVHWTAFAFALPAGRYLVSLAGAGVVIFGLWQFYRAVTRDRNKRVDLSRARLRLLIRALGVYGLAARGTLFCLVGGYVLSAAWRHDPRYSGGMAGALIALKQHPYGGWLLGAMAGGLLSYGVYQVAKEPFRKLAAS